MADWLNNVSTRSAATMFTFHSLVYVLWYYTKDQFAALMPDETTGVGIITLAVSVPVAFFLNAVIFIELKRLSYLRHQEYPTLRFCIAAPGAFWILAAALALQGYERNQDLFTFAAGPTVFFFAVAAIIWKGQPTPGDHRDGESRTHIHPQEPRAGNHGRQGRRTKNGQE